MVFWAIEQWCKDRERNRRELINEARDEILGEVRDQVRNEVLDEIAEMARQQPQSDVLTLVDAARSGQKR